MYSNDELASILINTISTHPSLDHKLHLMEALEKVFNKVKKYDKALNEIIAVGTMGTSIEDGKVVRSRESEIAFDTLNKK